MGLQLSKDLGAGIGKELAFRKEIEDYYLPKQLVDAIFELGEIPKYSIITNVGIGTMPDK